MRIVDKFHVKKNEILIFITFFTLFLISSFRNGLGTDYYTYAYYYLHPEILKTELLFKYLFIKIPRFFSSNELTFFIITSFTINYFILKTISKYSPIVLLSILLFLAEPYFISFNAVRQFIAIALFFYFGISFIKEKQIVKYVLLIFILAQIHFSFYIMLFSPLLFFVNYKQKSLIYIWLISFIVLLLQFFKIFSFSNLFNLLKQADFLTMRFDDVIKSSSLYFEAYTTNYFQLIRNLICITLLTRVNYFNEIKYKYWIILYLFGVIASNILISFSVFATRIGYISDIALLIALPLYIKTFKLLKVRIMIIIIIILYFTSSFYYKFIIHGHSDIFKKGEWIIQD